MIAEKPKIHAVSSPWVKEFVYSDARYKVVYGGRGGGKTFELARAFVQIMCGMLPDFPFRPPVRLACFREVQNTISESVKEELETQIDQLGLRPIFGRRRKTEIVHPNGSRCIFLGLSKLTRGNIRGLSNVQIGWMDEAQYLEYDSFMELDPTFRKEGSQLCFSLNPNNVDDPVYKLMVTPEEMDSRYIVKVNYTENKFHSDASEKSRLRALEFEPENYDHIWLGVPRSGNDEKFVLTRHMLDLIVKAWDLRPKNLPGTGDVGLDIAGDGENYCVLIYRKGPCIWDMDRWNKTLIHDTYSRAFNFSVSHGAPRVYYDSGGLGATLASPHAQAVEEWSGPRYPIAIHPINNGSAPGGADSWYIHGITNRDQFTYKNAQLAWTLKLRAQNTLRLISGADIDKESCLFINPMIGKRNIELLISDCVKPTYTLNKRGQIDVEKAPNGEPSPDIYDAVALSFARDSEYGLAL